MTFEKNRTQRKKISPRKSSWELILNIKLLQPKAPTEGRGQCGGRRSSGKEQFCSWHWSWSGQTLGFFSSLNRGHGMSFPWSRKNCDLGNKREYIPFLTSLLCWQIARISATHWVSEGESHVEHWLNWTQIWKTRKYYNSLGYIDLFLKLLHQYVNCV